jgi:hypothetical protein
LAVVGALLTFTVWGRTCTFDPQHIDWDSASPSVHERHSIGRAAIAATPRNFFLRSAVCGWLRDCGSLRGSLERAL